MSITINNLNFEKNIRTDLIKLIDSSKLKNKESIILFLNKKVFGSYEEQSLGFSCFQKRFEITPNELWKEIRQAEFLKILKSMIRVPFYFESKVKATIIKTLSNQIKLRKAFLDKEKLKRVLISKETNDYIEGVLIKNVNFSQLIHGYKNRYSFCIFEGCIFPELTCFDNLEHCIFINCSFPVMCDFEARTACELIFENSKIHMMSFEDLNTDFLEFDNCDISHVEFPDAYAEILIKDSLLINPTFMNEDGSYKIIIENTKHNLKKERIDIEMFKMMYQDSGVFSLIENNDIYFTKINEMYFLIEEQEDNKSIFHKIKKENLNDILTMLK